MTENRTFAEGTQRWLVEPGPAGRRIVEDLLGSAGPAPGRGGAETATLLHQSRLVRLARSIGARIALPAGTPETFDIGLVLSRPGQRGQVAAALALATPMDPISAARAVSAPDGIILRDADARTEAALRHALETVPGARIVRICRQTGIFDLFALPARDRARLHPRRKGLAALALPLGLVPCSETGAVVAGVNAATLGWLERRTGAGLVAVPRGLQRFDLVLTGLLGGLSAREAADFLCTRVPLPYKALVDLEAHLPLRVETDLGRIDALTFRRDYAAIGLRIGLRWRPSNQP